MRVKWVKKTPTEEGWYWIKYKNKHDAYTICPCQVTIFDGSGADGLLVNIVRSARNDTFMEGPNHGGWGLKYNGELCPDIRFGPKIEEPE